MGRVFDIRVKQELSRDLLGRELSLDKGDLSETGAPELSSVIGANGENALLYGEECLVSYKMYGAYGALCLLLEAYGDRIVMEDKVTGVIGGVPLLGKPDLWAEGPSGVLVLDWKVNGFFSKASASRGWCTKYDSGGVKDGECTGIPGKWADQVGIYGMLLSGSSGSDCIIDQLYGPRPMRVARSRGSVETGELKERLYHCWSDCCRVNEGRFTEEEATLVAGMESVRRERERMVGMW